MCLTSQSAADCSCCAERQLSLLGMSPVSLSCCCCQDQLDMELRGPLPHSAESPSLCCLQLLYYKTSCGCWATFVPPMKSLRPTCRHALPPAWPQCGRLTLRMQSGPMCLSRVPLPCAIRPCWRLGWTPVGKGICCCLEVGLLAAAYWFLGREVSPL